MAAPGCYEMISFDGGYRNPDHDLMYLIRFNSCIRGLENIDKKETVKNILNYGLYRETIFTKGHDRLYELKKFMKQLHESPFLDPITVGCLIAMFIVTNQVFGDGNHRTGIYAIRMALPSPLWSYYDKDHLLMTDLHELMNDQLKAGYTIEGYLKVSEKNKINYIGKMSSKMIDRMFQFVKTIET
jgi:hypothetical protein